MWGPDLAATMNMSLRWGFCCSQVFFISIQEPYVGPSVVKTSTIFRPIDSAPVELLIPWKLFWLRGALTPPVCTVEGLRLRSDLVFPYYIAQSFRSCALSPFLWVVSFYILFCPSESTIELVCSCGGMFRSTPFVCACISHVVCTESNNSSLSECIELSITAALHVDIPLYPNWTSCAHVSDLFCVL